ncbi:MAG: transient receptor potential channel pyrexia [Rickettsiaceae bacterium]|nr:transient receptor potential channel pyrexia [Rickettsiaceae bacterium]
MSLTDYLYSLYTQLIYKYYSYCDNDGLSALQIAIANKDKEAVKILIESGEDTNYKDKLGRYPLYFATGDWPKRDILELLLKHGANPNYSSINDDLPLNSAVKTQSIDYVKLMLKYGANPNKEGKYGATPLHIAAKLDNTEIIKLLVNTETDLNKSSILLGWTPLHEAAEYGSIKAIHILKKHSYATFNYTPLQVAAIWGSLKAIEQLISLGADANKAETGSFKPIQLAAIQGHYEAVRVLHKLGATPLLKINENYSVLDIVLKSPAPLTKEAKLKLLNLMEGSCASLSNSEENIIELNILISEKFPIIQKSIENKLDQHIKYKYGINELDKEIFAQEFDNTPDEVQANQEANEITFETKIDIEETLNPDTHKCHELECLGSIEL